MHHSFLFAPGYEAAGLHPLDPSRRPAAHRAGRTQGEVVANEAAASWG